MHTYYVATIALTRQAELLAEAEQRRRAHLVAADRRARRDGARWWQPVLRVPGRVSASLASAWQRGWVGRPVDGRAYAAFDRLTAPAGGNEAYGPAARPTHCVS